MKWGFFGYVLKTFFLLFLSLALLRLQFLLVNHTYLTWNLLDLWMGLRFDLSLVGYLAFFTLPLYYLISWIKDRKIHNTLFFIVSTLLFLLCLLPECWDLVYFQYTLKRSSFDLYRFFTSGEDQQMLGPMLRRFWYVPFLCVAWLGAFFWHMRLLERRMNPEGNHSRYSFGFAVAFALSFLMARNSFGPKPLGVLDATVFGDPARSQLRLNSPFVVLKTLHNAPLPDRQYMHDEASKRWFNPHFSYRSSNPEKKPNVIFIILESFGTQQLGKSTNQIAITPFLDSLLHQDSNTVACQGLANGKTSIECLPALFSGIPSLLEVPFVLSNFSTNRLNAFPALAQSKGYQTLFFHGAEAGSMRFQATAHQLGFQHTFFKHDLHASSDLMGSWGYHDEVVFDAMIHTLNTTAPPFLSAIFTLSSHEPYDIPQQRRNKYPQLTREQAAYRYTDDCLRTFFNRSKRQKWYKNTVFVLTADHTPVHLSSKGYRFRYYYEVPIAVVNLPTRANAPQEHLEIVPWLIKQWNWDVNWYGYGNGDNPDKIRYLNGIYHVWNPHYHLQFNEQTAQWKVVYTTNTDTNSLERAKKRFLALLQRYRHDLRYNALGM